LNIPQHKLRIVAPDVGGGFGVKQFLYAEEIITTWASRKLGRPVKWVNERSEGFLSDAHGRDHVSEAELALDETGKFLGLKVRTIANMGGYLSTFGPNIPTNLYGLLLAGVTPRRRSIASQRRVHQHRTGRRLSRCRPSRGDLLLERLVDIAASEMKIDRAEIRRKNMIDASQYPYQTPVIVKYDSGDRKPASKGTGDLRLGRFAGRKEESKSRGKLRGIGLCTYVEACGLAPSRIVQSLGARAGIFEAPRCGSMSPAMSRC